MEEKSIMAITLIRVCQDRVLVGANTGHLRCTSQRTAAAWGGWEPRGVAESPGGRCLLWETWWNVCAGEMSELHTRTQCSTKWLHTPGAQHNRFIFLPRQERSGLPAAETGHFPHAVKKHVKDLKPWGGLPACPPVPPSRGSCQTSRTREKAMPLPVPPPSPHPLPAAAFCWGLAEATQINTQSKAYIKRAKKKEKKKKPECSKQFWLFSDSLLFPTVMHLQNIL